MNLPDEIEMLIVEFSVTQLEETISDLAIICLTNQYFTTDQLILLTSYLVERKRLTINRASELLKPAFSSVNKPGLSDKTRNVIEVALITNEDVKDGIMDADADQLLSNALNAVYRDSVKK